MLNYRHTWQNQSCWMFCLVMKCKAFSSLKVFTVNVLIHIYQNVNFLFLYDKCHLSKWTSQCWWCKAPRQHNRRSFFHSRIKSYGALVHLQIKHTHLNSLHMLVSPASNVSVHWLPGNQWLTINQGFPLVGFQVSLSRFLKQIKFRSDAMMHHVILYQLNDGSHLPTLYTLDLQNK